MSLGQPKFGPNELNRSALVAIADIIANFHDWPVENLHHEGFNLIRESFPDIDPNFVSDVLISYLAIEPETRFSPNFNHEQFVSGCYRRFVGNA